MKKVLQHGERRFMHICNNPDYRHNWTHFDMLFHVWNELWHQSTYDNPLVDNHYFNWLTHSKEIRKS